MTAEYVNYHPMDAAVIVTDLPDIANRGHLSSWILLLALCLLGFCGSGTDAAEAPYRAGSDTRAEELQQLLQGEARVMVVAHRACWHGAPENSIRAVQACIELGVDMVEIDVRRTKDGHLIVMHDATVNRTTNGTGRVADLTAAEVVDLRLRAGQGGDEALVTEHRVPTLEQLLATSKDRILVNIDAKADVRDESFRVAAAVGVADQVLIKIGLRSPDEVSLSEMAFFGRTHFMPIVREEWGSLEPQVRNFRDVQAVAFEIIYESEDGLRCACRQARLQEARCWVNTMWDRLSPGHSDAVSLHDPDAHWGHLVRVGVDMIQTDHPQQLIRYLVSAGLR